MKTSNQKVVVNFVQLPSLESLNNNNTDKLIFEDDGNTWPSMNGTISFDQADNIGREDSLIKEQRNIQLKKDILEEVRNRKAAEQQQTNSAVDYSNLKQELESPVPQDRSDTSATSSLHSPHTPVEGFGDNNDSNNVLMTPIVEEEGNNDAKVNSSSRSRAGDSSKSGSKKSPRSWFFCKIRMHRKKGANNTNVSSTSRSHNADSSIETNDELVTPTKTTFTNKNKFLSRKNTSFPKKNRNKELNKNSSQIGLMEDHSINVTPTTNEEDLFKQQKLSPLEKPINFDESKNLDLFPKTENMDFFLQPLELQPVSEFESTISWNVPPNGGHLQYRNSNSNNMRNRKSNHRMNQKKSVMVDPGIARREALMRKLNKKSSDVGPTRRNNTSGNRNQTKNKMTSDESVAISFMEADTCVSSMTGTVEKISRQLHRRHELQQKERHERANGIIKTPEKDELGNDRFLGKTIRIRHANSAELKAAVVTDSENESDLSSNDYLNEDDLSGSNEDTTYLECHDPHEKYIKNRLKRNNLGKKEVSWKRKSSSSGSSSSSSSSSSDETSEKVPSTERTTLQDVRRARSRNAQNKIELLYFQDSSNHNELNF